MKNTRFVLLFMCVNLIVFGQVNNLDTISNKNIYEINLRGDYKDLNRLNSVDDHRIFAGKKNEVIKLSALNADLSTNNYRQIMGKVPGISIWENDGSGIQTAVACRGLSPNRSWEFNVRMNGCDISSEAFGYPEAYFTPPAESLEKLEIIRGAGALQYGTQFGGVMNYVTKKSIGNKVFSFETQQTIGSYGLYNAYNAIGGKKGNFSYYGYLHRRSADGWRENSRYQTTTGHLTMSYSFSKKLSATLEYTHMDYLSQQPGGLTDSMFNVDHRQSVRSRNWFSTPWNTSAMHLEYAINSKNNLKLSVFNTYAQRNSIGYMANIYFPDSLNGSNFNQRQIDRDNYNNSGLELKYLSEYGMFNQESALSIGARVYRGNIERRKGGIGSTNSDFDLSIVQQYNSGMEIFDYKKDLQFGTDNVAFFIENLFQLTKKISITPGFRMEHIRSSVSGIIDKPNMGDSVSQSDKTRFFIMSGFGLEYKLSENTNFYANVTQAYRPVTYSELTPATTIDSIDQALKDANGYNADFGYRGTLFDALCFDLGAFYLYYNNRLGNIFVNGKNLRTNIGASVSKGIESFVQLDVFKLFNINNRLGNLSVYANVSLIDARYTRWDDPAAIGDSTRDFSGNYVENAPRNINRFGLTYKYKRLSGTIQSNHVGAVYTDALNTEESNANATIGKIDGYTVLDVSATYLINGKYNVKCGVNNLTNEAYATRRSGGYPGPGLLPGNGRTFYFSIGAKF